MTSLKRFYREGKVHKIEGVGIGLYLSRQIISAQVDTSKLLQKKMLDLLFQYFYLIVITGMNKIHA